MTFKNKYDQLFMIVLFALFLVVPQLAPAQDELGGKMGKLAEEFGRGKLSEHQLEAQYLSLQEKSNSSKEKGRIYLHLADTLSIRAKHKDSDKIVKYSKFALQQSLDTSETVRAYRILGDGLASKYRSHKGNEWTKTRHEIVSPYLHGLRIVLDNLTAISRQPLPAVSRYSCEGSREECKKEDEEHQRQIKERERIDSQNSLIDARDAFVRDCADEYAYAKASDIPDRTELERLAREILSPKYEAVTQEIVGNVAKLIAAREQRSQKKVGAPMTGEHLKIIPGRRKQAVPKVQETPQ